jgi:hypothetical protein
MNKTLLAVAAGISLTGLVAFIARHPQPAETRTEEYAVVSVFQSGKNNYISVTVGSRPSEEKEFEKEKNNKRYDLAPVIREVEKLNAQGFELINGSASIYNMS